MSRWDPRERPALAGVAAATALALLARFWALGRRVAHWDEGRVAWHVLQFTRTGEFGYSPTIHGPFLVHVDSLLVGVLGPTDFAVRLPVALVGGLLPAAAWLFRERLRGPEVVALALFLAANPVLLYYSRFMRNDVLVAGFAVFALGFAVRALDTDDSRYLLAAAPVLALAFTAKENAVVYVGMWVGALVLVGDHRARKRVGNGGSAVTWAAARALAGLTRLWRWRSHLLLGTVEFVLVVVAFYAPRPDLSRALGNPAALPGVVEAATLGAWNDLWNAWVAGGGDHPYLPYFFDYLDVLVAGALPVLLLGAAGFVADRYAEGGPRDLVAFAGYWGAASLLLYPLAVDISPIPWAAVHTVVPLAIPAAVAVGLVYERGRDAVVTDDRVQVGAAAAALLVVAALVAMPAVGYAYQQPTSNTPLVQFGQPAEDVRAPIDRAADAVADHEGTDLLYYGLHFNSDGEYNGFEPPPNWAFRLPMPWYVQRAELSVTSATTPNALEDPPPVIIAPSEDSAVDGDTAAEVAEHVDGYARLGAYAITQDVPGIVYAVVFVDRAYLDDAEDG